MARKLKFKPHKGIKKRFKLTRTGKLVYKTAGSRHLATTKNAKRKRRLRRNRVLNNPKLTANYAKAMGLYRPSLWKKRRENQRKRQATEAAKLAETAKTARTATTTSATATALTGTSSSTGSTSTSSATSPATTSAITSPATPASPPAPQN